MSPASFAPIQRFNQILDKRGQPDGVSFVCHLNAKFTPVFLHTVSHIHLGRSEGCLRTLKSMRACRVPWLSGFLTSVLQRFPYSFHRRFRQVLGTGFTVSTALNRVGAARFVLGNLARHCLRRWIRLFCNALSSEDADITEQEPLFTIRQSRIRIKINPHGNRLSIVAKPQRHGCRAAWTEPEILACGSGSSQHEIIFETE
jgi:hypothetical protein